MKSLVLLGIVMLLSLTGCRRLCGTDQVLLSMDQGFKVLGENDGKTARQIKGVADRVGKIESRLTTVENGQTDLTTKFGSVDLTDPDSALSLLMVRIQEAPARAVAPSALPAVSSGGAASDGSTEAVTMITRLEEVAQMIEAIDLFRSRINSRPAPDEDDAANNSLSLVQTKLVQLEDSLTNLLARQTALEGSTTNNELIQVELKALEGRVTELNAWALQMVGYMKISADRSAAPIHRVRSICR